MRKIEEWYFVNEKRGPVKREKFSIWEEWVKLVLKGLFRFIALKNNIIFLRFFYLISFILTRSLVMNVMLASNTAIWAVGTFVRGPTSFNTIRKCSTLSGSSSILCNMHSILCNIFGFTSRAGTTSRFFLRYVMKEINISNDPNNNFFLLDFAWGDIYEEREKITQFGTSFLRTNYFSNIKAMKNF